jgi:hypothetical protein
MAIISRSRNWSVRNSVASHTASPATDHRSPQTGLYGQDGSRIPMGRVAESLWLRISLAIRPSKEFLHQPSPLLHR